MNPPPGEDTPAQGATAEDFAKREARTHFNQGLDAFVQGAFEAALTQFRLSAELYPTRAAVTNASLCLQRLGRGDEALTLLKTIPERFGPLSPDEQKELDRVVADLSNDVGWIELSGAKPDTAVLVDGRVRGRTPLGAPLYVKKGIHQLRLADVPPIDMSIDVIAGQANVVAVPQPRLETPTGPAPTDRDGPSAAPPKPARFSIGADVGAALASLGGDIAGCSGCASGIGAGVRAVGRLSYRLDTSWAMSLEAGYLRLAQDTNPRNMSLFSPDEVSETGSASDALTMSGAVVGAAAEFRLPLPIEVSLRGGLGVFVGGVRDERQGMFQTSAAHRPANLQFSVNPVQRPTAQYAYASVGATIGYRFADRWRVSAAVDVMLMGALGRPRWDEGGRFIGGAGESTFSSDALASTFLAVFCPSLGLALDF